MTGYVSGLFILLVGLALAPAPRPPAGPVSRPPLTAPKVLHISEAQGALDPAVMATADVSAVVLRASHGTQVDSQVLAYAEQLEAAGIPVAALYHEYDPALPWGEQYEALAAVMVETGVQRAVVRLTGAGLSGTTAAGVGAVMARLTSEFPLPLTYRHMVQTDAVTWQALGRPAWGVWCELWIVEPGIVSAAPGVPAPWKSWRLWQYTTTADGPANGVGSATVSVSRFNGSSAQFEGWVALGIVYGGGGGR